MDAVLASIVAVVGTLAGSWGTLIIQQRAAARAERRAELRRAGAAFLGALTAYRAGVFALSQAREQPDRAACTAAVRSVRAALTAARDDLLLATADPAIARVVHDALGASFALGDDTEQRGITTGRPAALEAHHSVLSALAEAIRSA